MSSDPRYQLCQAPFHARLTFLACISVMSHNTYARYYILLLKIDISMLECQNEGQDEKINYYVEKLAIGKRNI